jgi:small GTP-binding protein
MTLLDHHEARRQAVLDHLREIAKIADDVGMKTLRADLVETRIPKLEDERFNLVVLGEFNHGKSTFVNALLGAEVLPAGITPTTAAINHVVYSDTPRARAVLDDGSERPIDPKSIADWVTVEGANTEKVRFVEVGHPAPLLRAKVTLVDTPGVNDLNEQRAEITYGYVPRADAVLFLLDAGQALKESEREFLSSRILERSRDRLVFVLGKTDLLTAPELEDVMAYVRENLAKLVPDPPIFAISARKHLAGDLEGGRMQPLLEQLERTLSVDRGRVILDNAAIDGLRAAQYLRQNLGVKKSALSLSVAELESRVGKVHEQLTSTRESLDKLHGKIAAEGDGIKAQVRLDLERFTQLFLERLPEQIDATDALDVKRYLPPFIQDKFKEWAELTGERVGALLERLAEEVITVTNENARAASQAVADRLGGAGTKLEVEVDTFKYDVSVYAVGAIGTGVFLFVNSLAGGLLTLAAPILAIVLHSRVSAEIKDHAKEHAPAAIRKAAEAMRPHLLAFVDDFVKKLDDFVSSAGDKLFAGISEILDRAISERRKAGAEVAPIAAEVEAQLERLQAVEAALTQLRTQLWE